MEAKLSAQETKASIGIYTPSGRRVATMSTAIVDTGMSQWKLAELFAAAPEMAELLERYLNRHQAGNNEAILDEEARTLLAKLQG